LEGAELVSDFIKILEEYVAGKYKAVATKPEAFATSDA